MTTSEIVWGGQLHWASWCRRAGGNRLFGGQHGAVPKPWFSAQPACQKMAWHRSASCIVQG
jgi:hypothetical protein